MMGAGIIYNNASRDYYNIGNSLLPVNGILARNKEKELFLLDENEVVSCLEGHFFVH